LSPFPNTDAPATRRRMSRPEAGLAMIPTDAPAHTRKGYGGGPLGGRSRHETAEDARPGRARAAWLATRSDHAHGGSVKARTAAADHPPQPVQPTSTSTKARDGSIRSTPSRCGWRGSSTSTATAQIEQRPKDSKLGPGAAPPALRP
jgi:hypothetical protein